MPPLREQQMEELLANISKHSSEDDMLFSVFGDPQRSEPLICFAPQMHWNPTGTLLEPSFQTGRPIAYQFVRLQGKLLRSHAEHVPDTCLLYVCKNLMLAMLSLGAPFFFTLGTYERDNNLLSRTQSRLHQISRHMEVPFKFPVSSTFYRGETSGRKAVATAMIWSCQAGSHFRPKTQLSQTELLLKYSGTSSRLLSPK